MLRAAAALGLSNRQSCGGCRKPVRYVVINGYLIRLEAIRERSDKKVLYYVFTFLPILLGILLPIFLGLFLITPTTAIAWAGVGVLTSKIARDFFALP